MSSKRKSNKKVAETESEFTFGEDVDTTIDERIKPASENATGTQRHEIAASRGDEVAFHSMPQAGVYDLDNLKG